MQKTLFIIIIVVFVLAGFYVINKGKGSEGTPTAGTEIGQVGPDFAIMTIEDKRIQSTSLRGKIVVITSSAAWCPTCVMEAQQFAPVYQKYKDKGVVFITVDIDPRDNKDFIQQFKTNNNTPWYYADAQGGAEIIKNYSFDRFEITYILDKKGVIRFKDSVITSSYKLEQEIEKLL